MSGEFHFPFWCDDTLARFLLKAMKYVNQTCQLDGVNRAISITLDIRHYLDNARATEALEWLGLRMFKTLLRPKYRSSEKSSNGP